MCVRLSRARFVRAGTSQYGTWRHIRQAGLLVAGLAFLLSAGDVSRAASCQDAAHAAEISNRLPSGLLAAIGRIESGGQGGRNWSVNANMAGSGQHFASADDAEQYVQGLLAVGHRMIDVGCFQVDLFYHPDAFLHWQDAFDSQVNAEAAAHILQRLHDRTNDWYQAVALYHSGDPERGQPYLRSVLDAWNGITRAGVTGEPGITMPPRVFADPYVVMSSLSAVHLVVWTPDGSHDIARAGQSVRVSGEPRIITP